MNDTLRNDNDDELALYPRRAAIKLDTSRPGASAWRRYLCLIARSLPPLTRCIAITAHLVYPGRADICFARRDEPHY